MSEKDRKILEMLQENGRLTNVDLAKAVELTPSATLERVRKLEEKGFITGYTARVDPMKVGLGLAAFIFVRIDDREDEIRVSAELASQPFVLELHHLAGEDCFLVKVRAHDTNDLYRILKEEFGRYKAISSTRTTIVLHTDKETTRLPIAGAGELES
ncbi:MAG: Lrp/AsnC family transcriptional regulator [Pyrinomonadaceae bacterium]